MILGEIQRTCRYLDLLTIFVNIPDWQPLGAADERPLRVDRAVLVDQLCTTLAAVRWLQGNAGRAGYERRLKRQNAKLFATGRTAGSTADKILQALLQSADRTIQIENEIMVIF